MHSAPLHLPERPLERFEELYAALFADRGRLAWVDPREALRFSALALTPIAGAPAELARRVHELADELQRGTPWYGNLRSSVRFLVATLLLRNGDRTSEFLAEVDRAGELFRAHWKLSGNVFEALAILVLRQQSESGRVSAAQVARLDAIWREMKREHPWLTQKSDWPACALLCSAAGEPAEIGARLEALYRELRARKFNLGDSLQTASQILYFHPDDPARVCTRFANLYQGFESRGLWMNQGDYDEVALLSFTTQPEAEVVELVGAHRERIGALKPAPGKQTGFTLACGTATLQLVRHSRDAARLTEAQALLLVQVVLQAQQAIIASSAAGGAAAAGAN